MDKERVKSFIWQHFLLVISLLIMTLGVAVCIRSGLGSSVISTVPYVLEAAGGRGIMVPDLSVGQYTFFLNAVLVLGQILVLRRKFEPVQLFQLLVGFVFGSFIDLNMFLTRWIVSDSLILKTIAQVAGCTILGTGIAFEVRCGSITMPGEGFPVALSTVTGIEFSKMKICVDISLVICAVALCYLFFGAWQWYIVGVGTLFAMVYVGTVVRLVGKHLFWFDRLLAFRPGFRRYIYGLARYILK